MQDRIIYVAKLGFSLGICIYICISQDWKSRFRKWFSPFKWQFWGYTSSLGKAMWSLERFMVCVVLGTERTVFQQILTEKKLVPPWLLWLHQGVDIDLGKFHHDLTVLPSPGWSWWMYREIIPKWPNNSGEWNIFIYPDWYLWLS